MDVGKIKLKTKKMILQDLRVSQMQGSVLIDSPYQVTGVFPCGLRGGLSYFWTSNQSIQNNLMEVPDLPFNQPSDKILKKDFQNKNKLQEKLFKFKKIYQ